jgi:hypothetical protein
LGLALRQEFLEPLEQVRHGHGGRELAHPLANGFHVRVGMDVQEPLDVAQILRPLRVMR